MTQEYEFFKDFAGVTKEDLEYLKCGGHMKKSKKQKGGLLKKKNSSLIYDLHKGETRPPLKRESSNSEPTNTVSSQQKALAEEKKNHPERFDEKGSRKYNPALDDEVTKGEWNPNTNKVEKIKRKK